MTTVQKRKQVADFVAKEADERFINMIYAMMQEYGHAFQPMSEEEFFQRNQKSQKDIKANRVVSHNDVRKKFLGKK